MTWSDLLPPLLAASSGALLYACVYHLAAGLRPPRNRQHLLLAGVALLGSGFAVIKLLILDAPSFPLMAALNKWGLALLLPIYPLLYLFFSSLTGHRSRWWRPALAFGAVIWLLNLLQPHGLQFASVSGMEAALLSTQKADELPSWRPEWGFAAGLAWAIGLLGACVQATWRLWQRERSRRWLLLFLSTVFLLLSSFGGGLGRLGVLPIPQLGLFGLLAVTLILSAIFIHDEREHRQRDAESRAAVTRRLSSLFEAAPEGIIVCSSEGRVLAANPACEPLFGFPLDELKGKPIEILVPRKQAEHHHQLRHDFQSAPRKRSHGKNSLVHAQRADGRVIAIDISLAPLEWGGESCTLAFVRDVSDLIQTLERLRWLARHDELTGLPNLNSLAEQIDSHIERQEPFVLALLGLDHLGRINEVVGYEGGNRILLAVSERLSALGDAVSSAARFEGDKFAVVLPDVEDIEARLRVLMHRVGGEVDLADGVRLDVSLTAGFARWPQHAQSGEALLQRAATALLFAKRRARRGLLTFNPEQLEHDRRWLGLASRMPAALLSGEFHLVFQPRLRLRDRLCAGFEVLLRWNSPEGAISPSEFIPVAEESGFILDLGAWVMTESVRQAAQWQAQGLEFGRLAINLSTKQLLDRDLPSNVARELARQGMQASRIEFEITETAAMENIELARPQLEALAAMGLCLAMDDFGTGYSSLSYLQRLPFTVIKVDLSFTRRLGTADGESLMRSLLGLIKSMKRYAIAEGVETQAQLEWLLDAGFDEGQGYHLGRPMEAHAAAEWMREHSLLKQA
ncbi:MAG: putative bifunctional diguanylate cyclase/phosphodiesterase [Lysobacterales bacterium]